MAQSYSRDLFQPHVSVIMPLFGSHYGTQTIMIAVSSWLGQDVPCEVIVALGDGVGLPIADSGSSGSRLVVVRSQGPVTAGSPLRNLGARSARSRLLYHSDADVLPLRRDFLRQGISLIGVPGRNVVAHPRMYRLIPAGPPQLLPWRLLAVRHACYVTADTEGVLTPMPGERFVWRGAGRSPLVIAPDSVRELAKPPGKGGAATTHHGGGLLLEKEVFEEVGGYCTDYTGWGCDDHDLLDKLASRRAIVKAWRAAPAMTCLHFEHSHSHVGADLYASRALLARRRAMGAEAMIRIDTQSAVNGGTA